ncbi:SRPBCC family protein [Lentzea tibetensis]|uniref:SRPBCC family protein n=1 Tax=Lentzea tibetensis TaxID=2591470 RepID=A0A563ERH7_9PSEU|nr:SRPBCC family protein [Lentzea tibetensis]TWP50269.1 SRPBCC family protein [Lentzea tibetensis]
MIRNVHERVLSGDAGFAIDRIQELWPPAWGRMEFDRPLGVGADGGHGPIRYRCTAIEPGRRVEFAFTGLTGTHVLEADGTTLRHTLLGDFPLLPRLRWAFVIRWLHDACLEDFLDRAETAAGRPPERPARWSVWVRLVRRVFVRRAQRQHHSVTA